MLDKKQMQEIQDLKLRGYTKSEILDYYEQQGVKPPSRPTISKYYDMDVGYTGAVKPPVRRTGNRKSRSEETGIYAAEPPSRR